MFRRTAVDHLGDRHIASALTAGFEVIEALDMTSHLGKSYARLAQMAGEKEGEHKVHFEALELAYGESVKAAERKEIGWGLFVCKK